MLAIGIDPGKKGGLAYYNTDTGKADALIMPLIAGKEIDALLLRTILYQWGATMFDGPVLCALERVSAMPGQGVTSTMTFGRGVGKIQGVLECLAVPYVQPTPQMWKKAILADTDKSKQAAIDTVRRRFPSVLLVPPNHKKEHDGIADALCLALYASLQS